MDNASIHHGEEVEELLERHGIFQWHTYLCTANTPSCDQVFVSFTCLLIPPTSTRSRKHSPRSSTICDAIVTIILQPRDQVYFTTCGKLLRSSRQGMQKGIFFMRATFDELDYHHVLRYDTVIIRAIYAQVFETCGNKTKNTTRKWFECSVGVHLIIASVKSFYQATEVPIAQPHPSSPQLHPT
jgi:hypothetical protein